MDYKQRMFYGIPDGNISKVPFYMAYPMKTVYMEELEYEKDMRKLKDLYPKEVRAIQEMVEDECDKMEYEGSLMFDEYPDKIMLNQIVKRIYNNMAVQKMDVQEFGTDEYQEGAYEAEQYEAGQYEAEQYEAEPYKEDMQAEELPLEGKLVSQMRPGGPGWGPGRPPGGPGGPGWGPGRPPGGPGGPGWGPGRPPGGPGGPGGPGRPPQGDGLQNLIQVLLFNEMYQRRCRHKRCRRWW